MRFDSKTELRVRLLAIASAGWLVATCAPERGGVVVRVLPNSVDCRECELEISDAAILFPPNGRSLDVLTRVIALRDGSVIIGPLRDHLDLVCDAPLRSCVPQLALSRSDTMREAELWGVALDGSLLSTIEDSLFHHPTGGEANIAVQLPAQPVRLVQTPGGALAMLADIHSPAKIGLPVHLLRLDGSISLSFGDGNEFVSHSESPAYSSDIAPSSSGLWFARRQRYSLQQFSPRGQLLRTIVGFRELAKPATGRTADDAPAGARLLAFRETESGLLVVLSGWPNDSPSDHSAAAHKSGLGDFRDEVIGAKTVIDVIDPVSGRLVATGSTPGLLGAILSDSSAAGFVEGSDGRLGIRIAFWRQQR